MSKSRHNNSGFSLLELLLYISVVSTVTLIISTTFISFNRGRGQVESKSEVNSALNFAMEKISQDLRAASSVTLPATAGESRNDITMVIGASTITYCVASGQLRREVAPNPCNASSPTVTSSTVTLSSPTFTRLHNTNLVLSKTIVTIEINIGASYNSTSPDWQYSESKKTTVALR